jgi:hypothetical protein
LYFDNQSNARRNNKEMLTMTQVHDIRKQYFEEGKTISQISKVTGFDRKTVRSYLNKEDFNSPPESADKKSSFKKLSVFKSDIDFWLTDDKKAKKKQRHTAKRVFDRLKEKYGTTFNCSYRTVAGYVLLKKSLVKLAAICLWSISRGKPRQTLGTASSIKRENSVTENT